MKRSPVVLAALLVAASAAHAVDPVREGSGARRETLNSMELKAFPTSAWSTLSDWSGGEGLDTAQTDGKVVVVLTWAAWNPYSKGALRTAQRLVQRNSSDDLIVVGVHDAKRWDDTAKKAGEGLLLAHDADGGFRRALLVDQDPDFYVIDRAGNLRYADIETSSVTGAVAELLAESRADAADYPAKVSRETELMAAMARRSSAVRTDLDLSDMPDMAFPVPPQKAFEKADWPRRWVSFEKDVLNIRNDSGFGDSGEDDIRTFAPPERSDNMFGRPPRAFDGRVTVVYFWSPNLIGSYERIQPLMDSLQRERWRDVNVIGIMSRIPPRNNDGFGQVDSAADEKSRERFAELVEYAKTKRTYEHTIVADADNAFNESLLSSNSFSSNEETRNVRYAVVAVFSSDKVMRFIGLPTESHFRTALEQTVRVDPGVQARRMAEEAWIRAHKE
jgi:thiol-disulfide isomerase/thioredoxin